MITRFSLRSQVSRAQFSWRVCLATALSMALPLLPLKAAKPPLARTPAPAMVEHDCAPWDGPAFGLWIPAKDLGGTKDSWISIRIWQRPEASRGQFTFPERSPRQKGSAMLFLKLPSPRAINWQQQPRQELVGRVRFIRISDHGDVLGELDFSSNQTIHLHGRFVARWISAQRAGCG